ncbi:MAG TPA: HlyD family efflux transporter periplasmic adaptor subunit [Hanamia sp.]|nr:HlyD family efflux transporter periplasmic adaptor subunit [Hanamia sp.]
MKNNFWRYILIVTVTVFLIQSCNSKQNLPNSKPTNNREINSASSENEKPVTIKNIDLQTLLKPTNEFVVASLPVIVPKESDINIPVKAYGTIEADTRATGNISARVSGRIEKLYLRYRFQNIKAGQKVLEIYSPEILTAEENLLFLLKRDATNLSFINAAKQKLLLLGMSNAELNKVIQTGKPLYSISVYSNYNGHVMDNGMNQNGMNISSTETQELSLKEGMYVTKGQTLFNIMNHKKTWAALQIFPEDQSIVKKGDGVKITPESDTSVVIKGKINFIEPFFRSDSKTLTARVYFENKNMLTLGSQVDAKIFTGSRKGLWLPQSSVLALGLKNVVFLKSKEGFMAHEISTGMRTENKIQILSGLNTTDTVAANAQYLVDSQSFIRTSNE